MAHFAELDKNSIVLRVLVVNDTDTQDSTGNEVEEIGAQFLNTLLGGNWKKTSYNTHAGQHISGGIAFRKNYAGIGYTYDATRDAFIPPKPEGAGWYLEEQTCIWRNAELEAQVASLDIGVTRV